MREPTLKATAVLIKMLRQPVQLSNLRHHHIRAVQHLRLAVKQKMSNLRKICKLKKSTQGSRISRIKCQTQHLETIQ